MKKRVLSILLCLCMVLALCPVTAFAETGGATYSLTLNFKYGTLYGQTGSYVLLSDSGAGDPYDVTHILDDITGYEPYKIVGFRSDTGDGEKGSFSDHDIVLEVVYEVDGSLAITVDGFEVGKTPNDCTVTVESTIPGVTFSETDIRDILWGNSDGGMDSADVFEAGMDYKCVIYLNNDVLELAPTVTVNGNTPGDCSPVYSNGVLYALRIDCKLGTPAEPAPTITINGPDVVCAQQDYEFSATASEGVTCTEFTYGDTGKGVLSLKDGVLSGTVPAGFYSDKDSFVLTVTGEAEDNTPVSATKTVQVSSDHIYTDGVCGCGAVQQYTITYDGGEGVEGSIPAGVKTHGEDFTLSSDTFTWDGFIQTGWIDKETGAIYELGATFGEDRDATLYPYWEKLVTVTAGFTTTVALGDAGEPGETTFELGLIDSRGNELTFGDQYFGAEITTDGAGSYSGTMTITATEKGLYDMLYEGAFIWQYDDEEAGWTYDDTVWGVRLYMPEVAARSMDTVQYSLLLYPTYLMNDGSFNLDLNAGPVDEMTFTNTYTAHAYELKHDATSHWDECDCGDIQNKEAHTYGDWKVTKEATQTAKGEKEHTCTVCGYTEKTEIPKRTVVLTGDDSSFALWAALFTLSAAAVITTVNVSKKKKADR